MIAGLLAATSLVAIFLNEAYRPGVYGVAIYYVLGVLYFAIAGRNRLVLSPEEEFALTQGQQGVPQESVRDGRGRAGGDPSGRERVHPRVDHPGLDHPATGRAFRLGGRGEPVERRARCVGARRSV